ncbi:MAG: metallophosphoesterase [Clostridia bacterium]
MQVIIAAAIIFFVFAIWIYIDTNTVERVDFEVKSKKIPKEFDGFKIVYITDIHNKTSKRNITDKVIEKANKEEADIAVLGGDYIFRSILKYREEKLGDGLKESHGCVEDVEKAWKKLKMLKAKDGVYAVLGNHDYWEKKSVTLENMDKSGVKSLDNAAYWLERGNARIRLGGTSDISEDMSDITKTVDEVNGEYTVLVCHSPVILTLPNKDVSKVDLMLAGHLHGGQINLFGIFSPLIQKRWRGNITHGRATVNGVDLILSKGVGTSLIPLRFCAKPDYCIITIRSDIDDKN